MKLLKINKKKVARGFTLVEVLLVVGFIALASIGVYIVYNKVQTGNAANTEARNIDTLRAGVKNIYGGSTNYNGLTTQVALDARIVPDSMRTTATGAGAITNSFGGQVTLASAPFNGVADTAFAITYNNVPGDVCSKLTTTAGAGFNIVTVNGSSVKDTSKATTGNNLNVATTASSCKADSTNIIVFTSL